MHPRPGECALFTVATNPLLAASGEGGGFHPPSIAEFFPASFLFEGTPFEMNRIILVRLVVTAVLVAVFVLAARRAKLVPGRGQNVAEMLLDFVRVNIAEETLGHNARRFLPMLTTIFFAVLAMNLTGVVPFLNIASTSLIGMPLVLAAWVYVMYLAVGVRKFGVGGYLKNNLFPPGLPPFLYVLVTPIEALQVFVFRPATLALRLTANMIAGHLILVLCFGATHFFLFEASGAMKAFSAMSLAAGVAFTLFEILVAALQAYIFALLAAVYLNMAVEEEH
ncbi:MULTISPECIES: F0F1 ATP synthase subunit A [unclassified Actinotalea]|uniref:F0F1 ATP synthase subunit A n=1 Tax=unclassified Actinotalea TaxID=2638618 RepID=UPI0021078681|nr:MULTISPECIES: F0F1 ATP synthase subunit A [unclassified Actinotalea]